MRVILQVMALGFAIAGTGLSASAAETTPSVGGARDNGCSKSTAERVGKLEGETEIGAAVCGACAR